MSGRQSGYVLELEAADYFKLDLKQVRDLSLHIEGIVGQKSPSRCDPKGGEKKPMTKVVTRTKSTDTSGLSRQVVVSTRTTGCSKPKYTATVKKTTTTMRNNNKKTVQTQTKELESMTPSPGGSLQSLPSISSSASVSPTLVCPHLSLDDIINRQHALASPHTIGLCKKCRLEPPPNVQSPLSPVFKPHSVSQPNGLQLTTTTCRSNKLLIRRRHSDQQVAASSRHGRPDNRLSHGDESLDYWLDEPEKLNGLELSSSLRNSVEFIRSNPTESGRILRIYKNGQPYEKPIRVSILRGKFMSLAHLLDHINGRTIIPYGARYLFHLGGQLVYSENELKHNSIYIVSGTRNFNFRANAIIEEAQRRKSSKTRLADKPMASNDVGDELIPRKPERVAQVEQQRAQMSSSKSVKKIEAFETCQLVEPTPSKVNFEHFVSSTPPSSHQLLVSGKLIPKKAETKALEESSSANKNSVIIRKQKIAKTKPKVSENLVLKPHKRPRTQTSKVEKANNNQITKQDTISKSSENVKVIAESTPVKKSKSIVRAKSELSDANGKRKKNVTFVDPESPKPRPVKKVNAIKPDGKQTTTSTTEKPSASASLEVDEAQIGAEPDKEVQDLKTDQRAHIIGVPEGPADETSTDDTACQGKKDEPEIKGEGFKGEWQYPGGREHDITPEERPISQIDADESTSKSKVVTPSPSLSLTGDSLRLSISLDEQKDTQQQTTRQVKPVIGKPCSGTNLPENNFKLLWVNGININDGASIFEETQFGQQQALLSPQSALQTSSQVMPQFKPKDTFHNWVCYSSRYDELVYPSGCLVVLWWILRDEQRYYSGHTLNVTALALCSHDKEVGASAQAGGTTCVHLWSLGRLETLRIVEDNQLVDLRLFSISLRNSPEDGCELVVGGFANKRLKVVTFFLDLRSNSITQTTSTLEGKGGRVLRRRRESLTKAESTLNAGKSLKTSQLPLGLMLASSVRGQLPAGHSEPLDDVVVSIGQQHFQVWFMDRKQRNFKPIESKPLGAVKMKDISDTLSCFARLATGEILVGTNQGGINLIRIKCRETSKSSTQATNRNDANNVVCELEVISLHQLDDCYAVTSLTRVSRNTFVSCDAGLYVRLWKIEQSNSTSDVSQKGSIVCQPLDSLKIPNDLGFICSILPTNRLKREPVLELILVSSRNVFISANMLISEPNSGSLNVIYDGHESPVTGLVSDRLSLGSTALQADYFTCALDCNICRWSGRMLVWKSILPSACACLAIHPTGFVLAVGSTDGTVYILDKVSGLLVSYFPLTPVCINCLAYSRDGALLASGCANGSIFILPVYDRGLKYKKVSIFQSPHPVVSLQFSLDNKYILTSVTQGAYQELVLWDLPNFRYMCQNVRSTVDKIQWFDSICSGSEDVRAIWENKNLTVSATSGNSQTNKARSSEAIKFVINLSCHRLVRQPQASSQQQQQQAKAMADPSSTQLQNLAIACDTMGHLRLFQYPCYDNRQGFYETRATSSAANCCRFLQPKNRSTTNEVRFVSTSLVGSIFLWTTC